ncbi:hypothetical protein ABIC59_006235 [Priestia aryabhattai]
MWYRILLHYNVYGVIICLFIPHIMKYGKK